VLSMGIKLAAIAALPAGVRGSPSRVEAALARVDAIRIKRDLFDLAALDRSLRSADLARAVQLVRARLEQAGFSVRLDPLVVGGVTVNNVVGARPGSLKRPALLIGAHYDSIAFPEGDHAPGAEDNASGTAALLELARVLGPEQLATEVRLVAFAAEEVGLQGSEHLVAALPGGAAELQAMINLDMVGYDPGGQRRVIIDGYARGRGLAGRLAAAAAEHTVLTTTAGIFSRGRSDHRPFAERGIPALTVATERWRDYPHYHTAADLPQHPDPQLIAQVVRAVAARVLLMAGFAGGDPVASAGPFVEAMVGQEVILDGADSFDPRGAGQLTYRWARLDGPEVAVTSEGSRLRFTPGEAGAYRFQLVVSASDGRHSEPELAAAVVDEASGCASSQVTPSWPLMVALLLVLVTLRRRAV